MFWKDYQKTRSESQKSLWTCRLFNPQGYIHRSCPVFYLFVHAQGENVLLCGSKINSKAALKCSGGQNVPSLRPNLAQRFWRYMALSLFKNTHPQHFQDGDSFQKYSSWWKSARLLIWAHKSLLTFRCYQEPARRWSTCVTLKTNHDPISQPPRLLRFSLHVFLLLPRELCSSHEWNSKCPLSEVSTLPTF